jgi:hypothetical protein
MEARFDTSEQLTATSSFDALNLKEDLLRGIFAYGKPYYLIRYP